MTIQKVFSLSFRSSNLSLPGKLLLPYHAVPHKFFSTIKNNNHPGKPFMLQKWKPRIGFGIVAAATAIVISGVFYQMINKLDQSPQINLEILHNESVLPVLPLMNRWATAAYQKPPYSFAGIHTNDLVDPQDLFYVNDPKGVVIVAKNKEQVIGIAAGLPFDSRDLQSYLESRHAGACKEIIKAGFDPSQMFYLTYILTSPEFHERPLLSRRIFDAVHNWAVCIGKKQICWQEDVSNSNGNTEKIEPWKEDISGFKKMGLQFKFCWPTRQLDGTIKETEHTMEFFYKEIFEGQ